MVELRVLESFHSLATGGGDLNLNAFVSATAMTGLVAGTNGLVLTKIDDSACSKLSALTDLTLGTKALALGSTLGADGG